MVPELIVSVLKLFIGMVVPLSLLQLTVIMSMILKMSLNLQDPVETAIRSDFYSAEVTARPKLNSTGVCNVLSTAGAGGSVTPASNNLGGAATSTRRDLGSMVGAFLLGNKSVNDAAAFLSLNKSRFGAIFRTPEGGLSTTTPKRPRAKIVTISPPSHPTKIKITLPPNVDYNKAFVASANTTTANKYTNDTIGASVTPSGIARETFLNDSHKITTGIVTVVSPRLTSFKTAIPTESPGANGYAGVIGSGILNGGTLGSGMINPAANGILGNGLSGSGALLGADLGRGLIGDYGFRRVFPSSNNYGGNELSKFITVTQRVHFPQPLPVPPENSLAMAMSQPVGVSLDRSHSPKKNISIPVDRPLVIPPTFAVAVPKTVQVSGNRPFAIPVAGPSGVIPWVVKSPIIPGSSNIIPAEPFANTFYGSPGVVGSNMIGYDLLGSRVYDKSPYNNGIYGFGPYRPGFYDSRPYGTDLYGNSIFGLSPNNSDLYRSRLYGFNPYTNNLLRSVPCGLSMYGYDPMLKPGINPGNIIGINRLTGLPQYGYSLEGNNNLGLYYDLAHGIVAH